MTTKITFTPAEPDWIELAAMNAYPEETVVDIPSGSQRVRVASTGDGWRVYGANPAGEPDTIPMSEMKPGEWAEIATVNRHAYGKVGELVFRGYGFENVSNPTKPLCSHNYTVRLLQSGDSLLIEVVDEPDVRDCSECQYNRVRSSEPPCSDDCWGTAEYKNFVRGESLPDNEQDVPLPETLRADADDKFERLADGVTRMECKSCGDGPLALECKRQEGSCVTSDPRGCKGNAHPCWRPIEPTLDDALRTGTAKEIESLIGGDTLGLNKLVRKHVGNAMRLIEDIVYDRDGTSCSEDELYASRVWVELRDRLDLFGGNDAN